MAVAAAATAPRELQRPLVRGFSLGEPLLRSECLAEIAKRGCLGLRILHARANLRASLEDRRRTFEFPLVLVANASHVERIRLPSTAFISRANM